MHNVSMRDLSDEQKKCLIDNFPSFGPEFKTFLINNKHDILSFDNDFDYPRNFGEFNFGFDNDFKKNMTDNIMQPEYNRFIKMTKRHSLLKGEDEVSKILRYITVSRSDTLESVKSLLLRLEDVTRIIGNTYKKIDPLYYKWHVEFLNLYIWKLKAYEIGFHFYNPEAKFENPLNITGDGIYHSIFVIILKELEFLNTREDIDIVAKYGYKYKSIGNLFSAVCRDFDIIDIEDSLQFFINMATANHDSINNEKIKNAIFEGAKEERDILSILNDVSLNNIDLNITPNGSIKGVYSTSTSYIYSSPSFSIFSEGFNGNDIPDPVKFMEDVYSVSKDEVLKYVIPEGEENPEYYNIVFSPLDLDILCKVKKDNDLQFAVIQKPVADSRYVVKVNEKPAVLCMITHKDPNRNSLKAISIDKNNSTGEREVTDFDISDANLYSLEAGDVM